MTRVSVKASIYNNSDANGWHFLLRLEAGTNDGELYDELSDFDDIILFEKDLMDINNIVSTMLGTNPDRLSDRFTQISNILILEYIN